MGWIQNMISYINAVLPFIRKFDVKVGPIRLKNNYDLGRVPLFIFRISRDVLNAGINLSRSHIMMGFHIVGMLSSSYQGGTIAGGKRLEVMEREAAAEAYEKTLEHKS